MEDTWLKYSILKVARNIWWLKFFSPKGFSQKSGFRYRFLSIAKKRGMLSDTEKTRLEIEKTTEKTRSACYIYFLIHITSGYNPALSVTRIF